MLDDVRKNPALLKLDLYCKGIRIDENDVLAFEHSKRGVCCSQLVEKSPPPRI